MSDSLGFWSLDIGRSTVGIDQSRYGYLSLLSWGLGRGRQQWRRLRLLLGRGICIVYGVVAHGRNFGMPESLKHGEVNDSNDL